MATNRPKLSQRPTPIAKPKTKPKTAPTNAGSEKSIQIRPISNGHIISESSMDKKGNFNHKETYSPTPPVIQMNTAPMKSKGK